MTSRWASELALALPLLLAAGILIWASTDTWAEVEGIPTSVEEVRVVAASFLALSADGALPPLAQGLETAFSKGVAKDGTATAEGLTTLVVGISLIVGIVLEFSSRVGADITSRVGTILKKLQGTGSASSVTAGFVALTAAAPVAANPAEILGVVASADFERGTIATLVAGGLLLLLPALIPSLRSRMSELVTQRRALSES